MILCCALTSVLPSAACAATWATGVTLQKRLADHVDVVWSGSPLRSSIEELGALHNVAVLIDRRIDPGAVVDLTIESMPLAQAFEKLAASQKLSFGMLGPVAYFGPPGAADRLRTLSAIHTEEVRALPDAQRRRMQQVRSMAWKDFAAPRDLLQDLTRQNNLELEGIELVPHDLWAAADLPALPLLDRLLLVTMQFDLDLQMSPRESVIRLTPAAASPMLVRQYEAGGNAKATIEKFAALAPEAEIEQVHGKIQVRASLEDHQRLAPLRQPPKRPTKPVKAGPLQTKIEKLTIEKKPLGPVLEQLATRLHLDLQLDNEGIEAAGISLDELVSIDVKNATIDEVFEQLLQATPLTFRHDGDTIEIFPKP